MATSQNGWPAGPDKRALGVNGAWSVMGASFPGGVVGGPAGDVLAYVAEQFHRRVEALVDGWCWGWAYRDVRGTTGLSNHASGTAIDVNAPRHPLGSVGTFSSGQVATIHAILAEVGGTVRWGGDYLGRKDEMHFEINADYHAVAIAAVNLGAQEDDLPTPNDVWMAKCTGVDPVTKKAETHPAVEWVTVMGFRISEMSREMDEVKASLAALTTLITERLAGPGSER